MLGLCTAHFFSVLEAKEVEVVTRSWTDMIPKLIIPKLIIPLSC